MYEILGGDECLQHSCTEGSYEESENIDNDHYRCRKLHLKVHLHAYYDGQGHRQHGEEELVFYSSQAASQCHQSMKQGEQMNDPGCPDVSYFAHSDMDSDFEDRNFAPKIQF